MKIQYILASAALVAVSCSPSGDGDKNDAFGTIGNVSASEQRERASDGPFGISLGASIDSVPGLKKLDRPGLYETTAPPKAHPAFGSVVLIAYPETGICQIRGIGKNIENDGAGVSIRSAVDNLAAALETKYGPSEAVDVCAGGDIQCRSDFWMMTLLGGERIYGHSWESPSEGMKKNGIGQIYLLAEAADINTSYAILEFTSEKKDSCLKAEQSASAAAL